MRVSLFLYQHQEFSLHLGASPGSTLRPLSQSSLRYPAAMSRTEALKTQLDATQVQVTQLEVANVRLQSNLEIAQTNLNNFQAENTSLKQELQQLKELHEQLLRGTSEAEAEALPSVEQCASLERQVSQLAGELEVCSAALAEERDVRTGLEQELAESRREARVHGETAHRCKLSCSSWRLNWRACGGRLN